MKLFSKLMLVALVLAVTSVSFAKPREGWICVSTAGWGDYYDVYDSADPFGNPVNEEPIPFDQDFSFIAWVGLHDITVYVWETATPHTWEQTKPVYVYEDLPTYVLFKNFAYPIEP